jgi:hypothetical protein
LAILVEVGFGINAKRVRLLEVEAETNSITDWTGAVVGNALGGLERFSFVGKVAEEGVGCDRLRESENDAINTDR